MAVGAKRARKKAARKAATKAAARTASATIRLGVGIDPDEATPFYYINFAEVASSQNEIAIYGARLPTKFSAARLKEGQDTGRVVFPADVQIILPVTVVDGLIAALQNQRQLHEATFGKASGKTGDTDDKS